MTAAEYERAMAVVDNSILDLLPRMIIIVALTMFERNLNNHSFLQGRRRPSK